MYTKNRDILLELLQDMEDFARMKNEKCPPIYLLGGASCIIGGYIERATLDIDLLDMNYSAKAGKLFRMLGNIDILDKYLTTIGDDFESRAIKLEQFKYLDIFILSIEDIIVTKIGRYSEKDFEDIKKLMLSADKSLVLELIDNVFKRQDMSEIVLKKFSDNVKRFKGEFYV